MAHSWQKCPAVVTRMGLFLVLFHSAYGIILPTPPTNTTRKNVSSLIGKDILDNLNAEIFGDMKIPKIVGGMEAKKGHYQYQVAIVDSSPKEDNISCGGSLIAVQWVLTAAHCIMGSILDRVVILGDYDLKLKEKEEQRFKIKKVIVHEQYSHPGLRNKQARTFFAFHDIALLLLEQSAVINDFVKIINLPINTKEPHGYAIVSGWGVEEFGGEPSERLQRAVLPIVSIRMCQFTNIVMQSQLCAGFLGGGTDACTGDSGGPLVCFNNPKDPEKDARRTRDWRGNKAAKSEIEFGWPKEFSPSPFLCGVVSYGHACAQAMFPGVYTRVGYYLDWISKTIAANHFREAKLSWEEQRTRTATENFNFLGMVSNGREKDPGKICAGVLIHYQFLLTSSECCNETCKMRYECRCSMVDFDHWRIPFSNRITFDVSEHFPFDEKKAFNMIARTSRSAIFPPESKIERFPKSGEPLAVLRLSRGANFREFIPPLNLIQDPENLVGQEATLITLSLDQLQKTWKTRTGQFQIVECPEHLLRSNGLVSKAKDILCAQHKSELHCDEALPGSPLVCHGNSLNNSSPKTSSLCGITGRFEGPTSKYQTYFSHNPDPNWPKYEKNICVFRLIFFPEFGFSNQGISLQDLMAFKGYNM